MIPVLLSHPAQPFGLKTLQRDPNCAAIYFPDQVWGGADMLESGATETQRYQSAAQKQVPWLRRNAQSYTEGAFNNGTYYSKQTSGSASAAIVTDDYADGPFVGSRASRVVFSRTGTTSSDYSALQSAIIAIPVGIQEYFSLYIKSNTGSNQTLIFYAANDTGTTPRVVTATSTWTRIKAGSNGGPSTGRIWVLGTRGGSGQYYTGGDLNCDVQICCSQMALADVPYQPILTSWDATYTANAIAAGYPVSLWQDSAGTIAVNSPDQTVGKYNDLRGNGYNLSQPTTPSRPLLEKTANGFWRLKRDLVDDSLGATFPNLGGNCSMYVCDGSNVVEITGLTINGSTSFSTPQYDYGRVIFKNGTPSYRNKLIKWLSAKAGL